MTTKGYATTGRRALRIFPKDIQTGDLISLRFYGMRSREWALVTNLTPNGRTWKIEYLRADGEDGHFSPASNSKHDIRRAR